MCLGILFRRWGATRGDTRARARSGRRPALFTDLSRVVRHAAPFLPGRISRMEIVRCARCLGKKSAMRAALSLGESGLFREHAHVCQRATVLSRYGADGVFTPLFGATRRHDAAGIPVYSLSSGEWSADGVLAGFLLISLRCLFLCWLNDANRPGML